MFRPLSDSAARQGSTDGGDFRFHAENCEDLISDSNIFILVRRQKAKYVLSQAFNFMFVFCLTAAQ